MSEANSLAIYTVLADSRLVVRTLIGDFALTLRASLRTKWLRRVPVLRGLVRFFGLPIGGVSLSLLVKVTRILANFEVYLKIGIVV
jgi:hypothetical protein